MQREEIKKEMRAQGITAYKLAKNSGLQGTQVRRYLSGVTDLKGENIDKLNKTLNIRPIYDIEGFVEGVKASIDNHAERSVCIKEIVVQNWMYEKLEAYFLTTDKDETEKALFEKIGRQISIKIDYR